MTGTTQHSRAMQRLMDDRKPLYRILDAYQEDRKKYADDFLKLRLSLGSVSTITLLAYAARKGLTINQLRGAKKRIGAQCKKQGSTWYWFMPDPESTP